MSSSGVSGSGRRALPTCAMKAKSFMVPSRLRFLVRPNAISDIRDRSSAMSSAATPTWASTSHTASGNTEANRLPSSNGNHDRKSRPLADEQQVLTPTDLEDVAVPVAEPRRGLDRGQVVGLFQARDQLLCATKNDHRLCLRYDTVRAGDHHDADRRAAGPRSRPGSGHASGHDLSTHPGRFMQHSGHQTSGRERPRPQGAEQCRSGVAHAPTPHLLLFFLCGPAGTERRPLWSRHRAIARCSGECCAAVRPLARLH